MSRTVKLIVILAILEMVLVDIAIVALNGVTLAGHDPSHRYLGQLVFYPAWACVGVLFAQRRLTSQRPRLSDSHRRYLETGLAAVMIVMAPLHNFLAYEQVEGLAFDKAVFLRATVVFVGALMTVQGNFVAKLDPPTGERAPSAAVWTRTLMRMGWGMVLVGATILVAGLAAPPASFLPLMIPAILLGVVGEVSYQRMKRRTQSA